MNRLTAVAAGSQWNLLDETPVGILLFDPNGLCGYANPGAHHLLGYPDGGLFRVPLDTLLTRKDASPAQTGAGLPLPLKRADGAIIEALISTTRLQDRSLMLVFQEASLLTQALETLRSEMEEALDKSRIALAEAQRIARLGNWEWDIIGNRFDWSDELYRVFGIEPQAFEGTLEALLRMVHPKDRTMLRNEVDRILRDHAPLLVEHRIVRPGGEERIVEARAEVICSGDGVPLRMFGTVQDITEKRTTESGLQQLTQALESTREGMLIMDSHKRVIAANKAYVSLTGYEAAEMLGKNPFQFRTLIDGVKSWQSIWDAAKKHGHWEGEVQGECKNGEFYNERLTISVLRDLQGRIVNYIAIISDISRLKQSEEQLSYLATHDTLTGLPNRQHLSDRIRQLIAWHGRDGEGFALLLIDLDGFQTINSSLGHLSGNHVLQIASERLQSSIRKRDIVARLGGDEFALIFDGVSRPEEAATLVRKVHQNLAQPVTLGKDEIEIGASIGVAFFPADGNDPEILLQHAETALHRAKNQGRGICSYYTSDMTTNVSERFSLERALRRAVRTREGISLHFQPQVDALTGQCVGVEALMRWEHSELGAIGPGRFIPVAEESSLIIGIGEWVLEQACAELRRLLDMGLPPVRMAINISGRQFSDSSLVSRIRAMLHNYRLAPELLEIEITESSLMEDTMRAHSVLRQLKDLGVFIAIDDFGTGYSSLNYLKSFPLDILKIDKSFIDGIPGDEHDEAIARAVIAMAHGLRIRVTAEGVETSEQRRFLQMHGCDFLQGYLISRPVPAPDFSRWLIENSRSHSGR